MSAATSISGGALRMLRHNLSLSAKEPLGLGMMFVCDVNKVVSIACD